MSKQRVLVTCSFVLGLFAATAAHASPDGVWECKANGDIPLGLLTIDGASYEYQTTNTAWEPKDDASNGSGELAYEGDLIVPTTGPLLTDFEVNGAEEAGVLFWNNSFGTLFGCWPH